MDKTFAETQGHAPFDWNKWLDSAVAGNVTLQEAESKRFLSFEWVSCGVGNQCAIIPRDERGIPLDPELRELGGEFHSKVYGGLISLQEDRPNNAAIYYAGAKDILSQIEARSAFLIQKELEKLSSLKFLDTGRDEE